MNGTLGKLAVGCTRGILTGIYLWQGGIDCVYLCNFHVNKSFQNLYRTKCQYYDYVTIIDIRMFIKYLWISII